MILDNFLVLADGLTVGTSTAALATTSMIDTLAAGDDAHGLYAGFLCTTAILSGTAGATVTFAIQTSNSTAATSFVDLISSGAIDDAITVKGYGKYLQIPAGTLRYIQGTIRTSQVTTSGVVDVFLVKDADMNATMLP